VGPHQSLRIGAIVWAAIADPRGAVKVRPVVVATRTDEILLDQEWVGVAVTTTFGEPPPDSHVELPWDPIGHPATRLRRRSAAVCDWLVRLRASDVKSVEGYVPGRILLRIVNKVAETVRKCGPPPAPPSPTPA